MTVKLSPEAMKSLQENGFAISRDIGGTKKNRYWTPDGREIYAVPSIRDYVIKRDGKVVSTGTRDANYDKGWLDSPPKELKLRCIYCDKWHDTQEEINRCSLRKKKIEGLWAKKAKSEMGDVESLKNDVNELKDMFSKLMEKLNGGV